MMKLPVLEVDTMLYSITENTSEAVKYFEKNNYRFECYGASDENDILEISNKELKFKVDRLSNIGTLEKNHVSDCDRDSRDQKLRALIKEVEANATLFSQLEHLIRYHPVDQVLDCDIKLIVQNLQYWTTGPCTQAIKDNLVVMGDTTNLACLGLVAQILKNYSSAYIVSNPKTVVVCHLFMELCHKVGLCDVKLVFINTPKKKFNLDINPGCVGVITENADVDSAVEVLMESSSMSQWRLARVLVQENVYNTFKQAVQWKTRENPLLPSNRAYTHKSKCTGMYAYKDKVLLLDYAGNSSDNNDDGITVEAYRTTKELLSLVADGKHYYFMSLWSDSVSESNEIAYHDAMPNLVWINDFGVFGGPAESSQPFYEQLSPLDSTVCVNKMAAEKQMKWAGLTFDHRRNLIVSTLKEMDVSKVNEIVDTGLVNWNRRDVVYVDCGKMCVCITKKHAFSVRSDTDCIQILRDLAIGSAVVTTRCSPEDYIGSLLKELINVGAPIMYNDDLKDCDVSVVVDNGGNGYTKVVWSNYGKIFAN